jgi:cytochrome P450
MLGEIDARRSDPQLAERGDVLSMLILARFDDGSEIDDAEICDQLFTLLNASYETTATALAWTIDLLLHNRPALERLLDELEDGESDEYLRCVVKESLRLRPVLMLTGRELAADLETETLSLPAGTIVSAAIGLINTRPDLYPEPFAFKPERFLENPPTTYGWLTYGGGTRRCLGAAFAELQIRVVLRSIFSLRTLAAESDEMEAPRMRGITLTPPNGVRVIASPRDNHAVLK